MRTRRISFDLLLKSSNNMTTAYADPQVTSRKIKLSQSSPKSASNAPPKTRLAAKAWNALKEAFYINTHVLVGVQQLFARYSNGIGVIGFGKPISFINILDRVYTVVFFIPSKF